MKWRALLPHDIEMADEIEGANILAEALKAQVTTHLHRHHLLFFILNRFFFMFYHYGIFNRIS